MAEGFLLSRVLLRFDIAPEESEDLLAELSAIALTPDGSLWVGSDELLTLERLSPLESGIFGDHKQFQISDYIDLFNTEDEMDIEGMNYNSGYLWVTGSNSVKRKKPNKKNMDKNIQRLAKISTELNRFILARIPVHEGKLFKSCSHPEDPNKKINAGIIKRKDNSNVIMELLAKDIHLKPFLASAIPSKDNGLDIEGMAVAGDKVFLGLRGPVLRGWALIIEIEVDEVTPGVLTLKEIGAAGKLYKKHFVDLNGLGIRDLCFQGDDLIIVAGPTMALLDGMMHIFRLKDVLEIEGDSLWDQESGKLAALFDLPFRQGKDFVEGITIFPCLGQSEALLVVYDSPDPARRPEPNAVFADVFCLQ